MNLDQTLYLVVSDHRDGPIIWEIQIARMGLVRVIKDIHDQQYGDVLHVIEFNAERGLCRECTHDFKTAIDRYPEDL